MPQTLAGWWREGLHLCRTCAYHLARQWQTAWSQYSASVCTLGSITTDFSFTRAGVRARVVLIIQKGIH